jgi:hypothetical protein
MKNSHGYDGISTKILKLSLLYTSFPITYICNKMHSTSMIPTRLRFSEIKLLFEEGDKTHLWNYRPISLLTSFSKILENIIYEYRRLYHHIYCNHILVNEQFGFRNDPSTEIASYNLMNAILSSFNSKLLVGGVLCDLQNAIDCVNHYILLSKMEFYGISGKANKLIKFYLKCRYQRVLLKNNFMTCFSKWESNMESLKALFLDTYSVSCTLMIFQTLYLTSLSWFYLLMVQAYCYKFRSLWI